jgi:hypothetical protein
MKLPFQFLLSVSTLPFIAAYSLNEYEMSMAPYLIRLNSGIYTRVVMDLAVRLCSRSLPRLLFDKNSNLRRTWITPLCVFHDGSHNPDIR